MEVKVYNLIIVDKSGSMESVTNATIAGINETISSIKASARKDSEKQQFISLVAFCGCEQRYIFDNTPALEAHTISKEDYRPCCNTPLYDAVGNACHLLEGKITSERDSIVSVTIITDGYENSSREYNRRSIIELITRLKEKGWMFAYIGAEHDAHSVAFDLNIDNVMEFSKDERDVKRMFCERQVANESYVDDICFSFAAECLGESQMTDQEVVEMKKKRAKGFFSRKK